MPISVLPSAYRPRALFLSSLRLDVWPWVSHLHVIRITPSINTFLHLFRLQGLCNMDCFCYVFDTCLLNASSCWEPLWEVLRDRIKNINHSIKRSREHPGHVLHIRVHAEHPSFHIQLVKVTIKTCNSHQ